MGDSGAGLGWRVKDWDGRTGREGLSNGGHDGAWLCTLGSVDTLSAGWIAIVCPLIICLKSMGAVDA